MQLEVAVRPLKCGGTLRELDAPEYGLKHECEAQKLVARLTLGRQISVSGRVVCIHMCVQRHNITRLYCTMRIQVEDSEHAMKVWESSCY